MADYFRASNVRAILDLGFAKYRPLEEARALHDYAFETERAHRDVILGHWIHIDPARAGPDGVQGAAPLHRQADRLSRLRGLRLAVAAGERSGLWALLRALHRGRHSGARSSSAPPASAPDCRAATASSSTTAIRATSICVAARNPELKIVAARPGWPWQAEVIAVLMHKRNIWYELHGWSPKYHTPDLKHEIPRRLKDRVMFGGDYPLFSYERLVRDWRAEGYPQEVLDKVFHRNAERFLAEVGAPG